MSDYILDHVPNSSGWLQEIQYLRAISAIEVIVWHALLYATVFPSAQKEVIIVFAAVTSFAVPHFIFISGVVLYHNYGGAFHLSTFFKKRLSSIVPPYLVWSTFYYFYPGVAGLLYSALFQTTTSFGSNLSLSGFLNELANGIGQLWFIVLIIQFYLLYPLLVKLYNRFSRQEIVIYLLLLVFLAQLVFNGFVLPPLFFDGVLRVSPNATSAVFVSGIFYFIFGFFVAEHYVGVIRKVRSVRLSVISIVVTLSTACYAAIFYQPWWELVSTSPLPSQYIWLYQIAGPFYCLILIVFYLRLGAEWRTPRGFFTRKLERIGEDSFGIFLTHLFFLVAFAIFLTRAGLGPNNLLFYPTLILLTLILSVWSVQVLYRLPFSTITVGKPRKEKSKPPQRQWIPSA